MIDPKKTLWKTDDELFSIAKKELFVALVGDILDKIGFRNQFLPPTIKPLHNDFVVIGRAMPVLEADVFEEVVENTKNAMMMKPFGLMFEALDSLRPNEVYICSGASPRYALWGGLMSTRAMKLMASGAVLHGWSRDTNEILKLGFPTFSYGGYAQDQGPRGKVIDYRVPIEIDGVRVNPGDVIYGDRDGVLVVPSEVVVEAFSGAIEKARGEQLVKKALEEGMSTVDAFDKFGIM
ncbi:RraA family protein [Flagellimonas aequoris]|uniref:Putative 4-hydroxy-4-methyl-2-oxoglutarate aldolase n=1 Tax=Flagellimonas aequoris TaxID=2306997 RepID=A0A418N8F5_9FLAO|nr:RraA family protein [Allomuricauda aequoris]RIV71535.1 RraA family protein [Allomuricauda aequoris]TXK03100.1 RraA family protein [Allomuricauda aequoris]